MHRFTSTVEKRAGGLSRRAYSAAMLATYGHVLETERRRAKHDVCRKKYSRRFIRRLRRSRLQQRRTVSILPFRTSGPQKKGRRYISDQNRYRLRCVSRMRYDRLMVRYRPGRFLPKIGLLVVTSGDHSQRPKRGRHVSVSVRLDDCAVGPQLTLSNPIEMCIWVILVQRCSAYETEDGFAVADHLIATIDLVNR